MKTLIITLVALIGIMSVSQVSRAEWVRGYTRSNGTYVAPYIRSTSDGNPYNNYSNW